MSGKLNDGTKLFPGFGGMLTRWGLAVARVIAGIVIISLKALAEVSKRSGSGDFP